MPKYRSRADGVRVGGEATEEGAVMGRMLPATRSSAAAGSRVAAEL